jgi:hypothetical protein
MNFFNKLSLPNKFIFVIFVLIILYFLLSYIFIRVNYKPIFDWWYNYNGKQYNKLFNLFTLCAFHYSTPVYYGSKLLTAPDSQLQTSQYRFIIGQLLPFLRVVQNNEQMGLIIPRHMCETIMLSTKDGDNSFNAWFYQPFKRNGLNVQEGAPLIYKRDEGTESDNEIRYKYNLIPNTGDYKNVYGLYPSPGANDSWAGLILEWLGKDWVMQTNADGLIEPHYIGSNPSKSMATWFNDDWKTSGRPDNFLARMNIPYNSPLVIYFINNTYSTSDAGKVDTVALLNLLAPSGANAGGWIGFLNGLDSTQLDEYVSMIHSHAADPQIPPTPSPPCSKPNAGKGIAAALTGFLPLVGFAIATGGWGGLAIAGAGALTGGISGWQAGQGTC